MTADVIASGLLGYLSLLILLTFHEFAHAWTAWKCGDATARDQGRVSLNPIVHMDMLGTVILPLLVIFLRAADSGLANFIIGWGKPVPVDIRNLRHRRLDDAGRTRAARQARQISAPAEHHDAVQHRRAAGDERALRF